MLDASFFFFRVEFLISFRFGTRRRKSVCLFSVCMRENRAGWRKAVVFIARVGDEIVGEAVLFVVAYIYTKCVSSSSFFLLCLI